MKLAIITLSCCIAARCSASDLSSGVHWNPIPDFRQDDKRSHFSLGFMSAALAQPIVNWSTDNRWIRILAPALFAGVVGVTKEAWDYRLPLIHTTDAADASATFIGGVCYSFAYSWSF